MSTAALLPTFQRAEFQGRTDQYSPPLSMATVDLKLQEVLKGTQPIDVSGAVLGDRYVQDAITRLNAYRLYWRYYFGKHFHVEYDGGDQKTPWNFCRMIVNKRAKWITGKGFNLIAKKGNEQVAQLLDKVWLANRKNLLIRRSAKSALASGDAFWYFTVKTKDRQGNILPKEQWSVGIHPINPSFVFPLFVEDDPSMMKACMIQFPIWGNGEKAASVFTAFYTNDRVKFYKDYAQVSDNENPLGVIPIVHLPCGQVGDNSLGRSILEDIIPLNDAFNTTANSIQKTLKYHGEPTTIVYGTRLQTMEKGANKVWSNLPPPGEAKVEHLELKGDLAAGQAQLQLLEDAMLSLGGTPKICFDAKGLSISNTSGVSLQMLFQPLVECTIEDQEVFTIGINQGNNIIAAIHSNIFGEDISLLADHPEELLDMDIQWQGILPKDEEKELNMAIARVSAGFWSKAEAIRQVSGVKDSERLALELAADARFDIAMAAEKARALLLGSSPPNFSAVFTSSIFLSEDLLDVATKFVEDSAIDKGSSSGGE